MDLEKLLRLELQRTKYTRYLIAKETGVSQSVLSKFVSGRTGLSLDSAGRLMDFFGYRLRRVRMPKLKPLKRGGNRMVKGDKEGSKK